MQAYWVNLKRPWKSSKIVEVTIITCKRTVWAELPNKRRGLLGASVFFTLPSAERCRASLIQKIVNNAWIKNHQRYTWSRAQEAQIALRGTLH